MSSLLQIDNGFSYNEQICVNRSDRNIARIPVRQILLREVLAKVAQTPVCDSSINEAIKWARALGTSDNDIGCLRQYRMKQTVVGGGDSAPEIDLTRRAWCLGHREPRSLIEEMLGVWECHTSI
jgi:hypothetical protein